MLEIRLKTWEKVLNRLNIPKVESVLDIGGGHREMETILKPKKYICVNRSGYDEYKEKGLSKEKWEKKPELDVNLNEIKKFPFKNKSFDIVVLSHILEHLFYPEIIIKEAKRITKQFILLALPNELNYYGRLYYLIGKTNMGYTRFGHHYMFTISEIEKFRENFFNNFKVVSKYYLPVKHVSVLPFHQHLVNKIPTVFANAVNYLLELKKR